MVAAITLVLVAFYPVRFFFIEDAHGRKVFQARVRPGEQISISYIHSVERTPWFHYYEASSNNQLVLKRMLFKSFGAGVPDYAPAVRHVDGWIEYSGFNQSYKQLQWNIQDDLDHNMSWRGQDIRLGTLVASGTNARMYIAYRPIVLLFKQLLGG